MSANPDFSRKPKIRVINCKLLLVAIAILQWILNASLGHPRLISVGVAYLKLDQTCKNG